MERLLSTLHVVLVSTLVAVGVPATEAPAGSGVPVQAQESEAPLRWVRVSTDRARLLNLADEKGMAVAQPSRGTLLAVYDEHPQGWLAVELPGGFEAWVFGRYLEPAGQEEEGVYRVTRNAVNIRPGPSSDVTHFPLPQRLHAGDRVRVLETLDPTLPLDGTWAKILSPPGVRAWVRGDATTPLRAEEDGAALWLEALASVQRGEAGRRPLLRGAAEEASTGEPSTQERAREELRAAEALIEEQSKLEEPDYAPARTAIEALLESSPSGAVAVEARHVLARLDTLEEAATLRAQLLRERERRSQLAQQAQREVWEASRKKDPFGGVFLARGVLTRTAGADETPRYFLAFDGETRCELHCATGRYDLERFAGYYVGVQGAELLTIEGEDIPPVEVSRLEVLGRRR